MKEIVLMVEDSIDLMKTSGDDSEVVLVGGGSILIPEEASFKGVKNILKP